MRGEYVVVAWAEVSLVELPPRARRIPGSAAVHLSSPGTTSACAENTYAGGHRVEHLGNYLRVRGEYGMVCHHDSGLEELPPRARRIQMQRERELHARGTTSACAENTEPASTCTTPTPELPPRARRIRFPYRGPGVCRGTTSACAENTSQHLDGVVETRNYLRVRGEYVPG